MYRTSLQISLERARVFFGRTITTLSRILRGWQIYFSVRPIKAMLIIVITLIGLTVYAISTISTQRTKREAFKISRVGGGIFIALPDKWDAKLKKKTHITTFKNRERTYLNDEYDDDVVYIFSSEDRSDSKKCLISVGRD